MEIKEFIKKLITFYTNLLDDFDTSLKVEIFEKYKKEFFLLKEDYSKFNSDNQQLVSDINSMIQGLDNILSGDMNIEIIEEYLEDQAEDDFSYYDGTPFSEISFGDMVTSGMWSQIQEDLFDSSGVRIEEISEPDQDLNNPSRHEK
jgi:hypothetical protein